jgi:hypothetical protein
MTSERHDYTHPREPIDHVNGCMQTHKGIGMCFVQHASMHIVVAMCRLRCPNFKGD